MYYTGDRIYGEEGLKIGLYNRLVPKGKDLMTETMALAKQIAQAPSRAVARIKDNMNFNAKTSNFLEAPDHEATNLRELFADKEAEKERSAARARGQFKEKK